MNGLLLDTNIQGHIEEVMRLGTNENRKARWTLNVTFWDDGDYMIGLTFGKDGCNSQVFEYKRSEGVYVKYDLKWDSDPTFLRSKETILNPFIK